MKRWLAVALVACVVAARPASGAAFRVGPGEAYSTIQAAIDAALAAGGRSDVQIRAGEFRERLVIRTGPRDELVVSGGWGLGFMPEERVPRATLIDGGGLAPVVLVDAAAGSVRITGVTVTGGDGGWNNGGGIEVRLSNDARADLIDNLIRDNHLFDANGALGGGLHAFLDDEAAFTLRANSFERNSASTSSEEAAAVGGGANIFGRARSRVDVSDNQFRENSISAPVANASALHVGVLGAAVAEVNGNRIEGNLARVAEGSQSALSLSAGVSGGQDVPSLVARRNTVVQNFFQSDDPASSQVALFVDGGARLHLTDSLVALGDRRGITIYPRNGASPQLTNLTVVRHAHDGIAVEPRSAGVPALANTIAWLNGRDVSGTFLRFTNLIGVDPLFRDWPGGNYRLASGSRGIDAGTDSPPGGLGPWDLDGHVRRQGRAVDIGAYEQVVLGPPSDEASCRVLWQGVDRSTNACRCAMDRAAPHFNCGFFGPEVFLNLRIPWPPVPGKPLPVDWTIHPFASVAGPYEMEMAARIGGQWQPQEWLGPTAKGLEDGKLVVEPFAVMLPKDGRTLLRTTLQFVRFGEKEPTAALLDVRLPDLFTDPKR